MVEQQIELPVGGQRGVEHVRWCLARIRLLRGTHLSDPEVCLHPGDPVERAFDDEKHIYRSDRILGRKRQIRDFPCVFEAQLVAFSKQRRSLKVDFAWRHIRDHNPRRLGGWLAHLEADQLQVGAEDHHARVDLGRLHRFKFGRRGRCGQQC